MGLEPELGLIPPHPVYYPICHWCFDPVPPDDEVGDGVVYIAHGECHEIQT